MNRIAFFGDSFTSGENNGGISFTSYFKDDIVCSLGVSGTTIGEYSIYPVDGNSLLSLIGKNQEIIKMVDTIFIEYGINDVASIMCGFTTVKTVVISLVKAVDWIRQLNPNVRIVFLSISDETQPVCEIAKLQSIYLEKNYFKQFNFKFPVTVWIDTYSDLMSNIGKVCEVIPMIYLDFDFDNHIDTVDKLHPNNEGYKVISDTIKRYI